MSETAETLTEKFIGQLRHEDEALNRVGERALARQRRMPLEVARELMSSRGFADVLLNDRNIDGKIIPTTLRIHDELGRSIQMGLHLEGITDAYRYIGEIHTPGYELARIGGGVLMPPNDGLHYRDMNSGSMLPMNDVQRALAITVLTEAAELNGINLGS